MASKSKSRKKVASQDGGRTPKASTDSLAAAANDAETPVEERVRALLTLTNSLAQDEKSFRTAIELLKDEKQPSKVRLAALQTLQAASFRVVEFEPRQADYRAALHELMTDSDPEMRQRVLGILSREKDPNAQQILIEGLRDPSRAPVPAEKALQLLAYDIHTEAYAVAREIVDNPPNMEAKREALRLLASDAAAAPLLEKVLRDKQEVSDIRQFSAAALNVIDPEALQKHAKEIVLDDSEYPEIQATSLTALNQFGEREVASDAALRGRVSRLVDSKSELVQESARAFLDKHEV